MENKNKQQFEVDQDLLNSKNYEDQEYMDISDMNSISEYKDEQEYDEDLDYQFDSQQNLDNSKMFESLKKLKLNIEQISEEKYTLSNEDINKSSSRGLKINFPSGNKKLNLNSLSEDKQQYSYRNGELSSQRNGDLNSQRNGDLNSQRNVQSNSQRIGDLNSQRNGESNSQRNGESNFQRIGELNSQRNGELNSQRNGELNSQRIKDQETPNQQLISYRNKEQINNSGNQNSISKIQIENENEFLNQNSNQIFKEHGQNLMKSQDFNQKVNKQQSNQNQKEKQFLDREEEFIQNYYQHDYSNKNSIEEQKQAINNFIETEKGIVIITPIKTSLSSSKIQGSQKQLSSIQKSYSQNLRGRKQINDLIEDNIKSISRLSNSSSLKRFGSPQGTENNNSNNKNINNVSRLLSKKKNEEEQLNNQERQRELEKRLLSDLKSSGKQNQEKQENQEKQKQFFGGSNNLFELPKRITENDQENNGTEIKNEIEVQVNTVSDFEKSQDDLSSSRKINDLFQQNESEEKRKSEDKIKVLLQKQKNQKSPKSFQFGKKEIEVKIEQRHDKHMANVISFEMLMDGGGGTQKNQQQSKGAQKGGIQIKTPNFLSNKENNQKQIQISDQQKKFLLEREKSYSKTKSQKKTSQSPQKVENTKQNNSKNINKSFENQNTTDFYLKGILHVKNKEIKAQQLKVIQEKEIKSQCTFKPEISSKSKEIKSINIIQKTQEYLKKKNDKENQKTDNNQLSKEQINCTFKPQIIKSQIKFSNNKSNSSSNSKNIENCIKTIEFSDSCESQLRNNSNSNRNNINQNKQMFTNLNLNKQISPSQIMKQNLINQLEFTNQPKTTQNQKIQSSRISNYLNTFLQNLHEETPNTSNYYQQKLQTSNNYIDGHQRQRSQTQMDLSYEQQIQQSALIQQRIKKQLEQKSGFKENNLLNQKNNFQEFIQMQNNQQNNDLSQFLEQNQGNNFKNNYQGNYSKVKLKTLDEMKTPSDLNEMSFNQEKKNIEMQEILKKNKNIQNISSIKIQNGKYIVHTNQDQNQTINREYEYNSFQKNKSNSNLDYQQTLLKNYNTALQEYQENIQSKANQIQQNQIPYNNKQNQLNSSNSQNFNETNCFKTQGSDSGNEIKSNKKQEMLEKYLFLMDQAKNITSQIKNLKNQNGILIDDIKNKTQI